MRFISFYSDETMYLNNFFIINNIFIVPTIVPTINEIIPNSGPTCGGTRVVIIGSNFVDSPAARIKFDQTDVMPIFHGPGI